MAEQNKVQAEIMQAYREIFLHTPQGEMIFADMLKASGLFTTTGFRNGDELQHMEGSRDMVRRIIQILALDDETILQIALGKTQEIISDE
tara:strand:+ start:8708 stop:8977 length:270 start_codon:yes stop_codon:yes gene_type:complete